MKILRFFAVLLILFSVSFSTAFSQQVDIYELMNRQDLKLSQIEQIANAHFAIVGTGQGTGYKQFQRWLYEKKFHLDRKGFIIPQEVEWAEYKKAASKMQKTLSGIWQEKGPWSWTRTSGWNPGVGRLTSVAIDPSNNNILYVSSPGGGIWKTTNNGGSWVPLVDDNGSWMNVNHIAIDPANTNIIYAALNGGGVIKSQNGGSSWSTTGFGPATVYKVLIQPDNTNNVFLAASNGIYRSTNGGSSWSLVHNQRKEDLEFQPGNTSVIYATGNGSSTVSIFWRSSDNGLTWTAASTSSGITGFGRAMVAVTPADPNVVYLVQANGSVFGAFYKSTDAGFSFTKTISGGSCNNFFGYETSGCGTTGQATYDMAICASPTNPDEVHIAGIICWKTTNGGNTWVAETAWSLPNSIGYNHADVHGLEYVNGKIYSVSDGGIYVSHDQGDNWVDLSSGLGIRQFYKMASSKTNPNIFSGGAQDNGSSIRRSAGWIDWLGADGMDCLISPLDSNLQWGTSQNGSIYRTINGGQSYSNLPKPSNGNWVTPLAIESNTNVIYGGWTGVYKSTNLGSSWTLISGSTITAPLDVLAVAPSDPNYIYASRSNQLYVTTDGGSNWSTYTAPATISDIAVSPLNPQKIWLACASSISRVFVSTNSGQTFTNISGNLPSVAARTIVVAPNNSESVYVGMNIGVYYIDNNLSSWQDMSDNLPKVAIRDIDLQISGGKLRVATYGRGIWETELAAPCASPSNPVTTNITVYSASLSWTAATGASSYTLDYKKTTDAVFTSITGITATSYQLNGLTGGTQYEWRISAACSAGTSFGVAAQFTTLFECFAPSGPNATNVNITTATVNWAPVSGAVSYSVDYKKAADAAWTNAVAATTSLFYDLTGLSALTEYQWRVRANCGTSGTGSYATGSFTTLRPLCQDVYEPNNTSKTAANINPNTTITAAMQSDSDQDWFKLNIGNNNQTKLKITLHDLPADYDVFLYDKSNTLRAQATASGTGNDVIIFNSNTNKTWYTIKVAGKGGAYDVYNCYSLTVETSASNWMPAPGTQAVDPGELVVYPQPARNNITLSYADNSDANAVLQVFDMTGRLLLKQQFNVMPGRNLYDVDVSRLPAGVYMLQWTVGERIIRQKLVVQ